MTEPNKPEGKKAPDSEGMWVQGSDGLWYNMGKPIADIQAEMSKALDNALLYGDAKPGDPPLKGLFSDPSPAVAGLSGFMGSGDAIPPHSAKVTAEWLTNPFALVRHTAPTWRELAAAFEMTSGRTPIVAPSGLELEILLYANVGPTDPHMRPKVG